MVQSFVEKWRKVSRLNKNEMYWNCTKTIRSLHWSVWLHDCMIAWLYDVLGKNSCFPLNEYLRTAGEVLPMQGHKNCLIFDDNEFNGDDFGELEDDQIKDFCGVSHYCLDWILFELTLYLLLMHDICDICDVCDVCDFHDNRIGNLFTMMRG